MPQVDGINNFLSHSVNKWLIYLRIFICEIVAIILLPIVFTFHTSTNKDTQGVYEIEAFMRKLK